MPQEGDHDHRITARAGRDGSASFVTPQLLVGGDLDVNDTKLAVRQLFDLVRAGVTQIVDVREECDDTEFVTGLDTSISYLWHGVDDAGQRIPASWCDATVGFVLAALEEPETLVLTHCHMGIQPRAVARVRRAPRSGVGPRQRHRGHPFR